MKQVHTRSARFNRVRQSITHFVTFSLAARILSQLGKDQRSSHMYKRMIFNKLKRTHFCIIFRISEGWRMCATAN
jgi:hypothetical protein